MIAQGRVRESHAIGPLVWLAIISVTCLALFVFQKILWLVVPFLLALILYYLLAPPVRWLVLRGWSVDAATGLVMGVLVAGLVIAMVLGLPWLAAHMIDWQASMLRYINGGLQLLDSSLRMLESHWSVLADAGIANKVSAKLFYWSDNFTGDQIEPILMNAGSWLPILLLVPFITFFQLRDGAPLQRLHQRCGAECIFREDAVSVKRGRPYDTCLFQRPDQADHAGYDHIGGWAVDHGHACTVGARLYLLPSSPGFLMWVPSRVACWWSWWRRLTFLISLAWPMPRYRFLLLCACWMILSICR